MAQSNYKTCIQPLILLPTPKLLISSRVLQAVQQIVFLEYLEITLASKITAQLEGCDDATKEFVLVTMKDKAGEYSMTRYFQQKMVGGLQTIIATMLS